nr:1,6-anhydro-N-acetylmuramyl-L-alanine amidase AmpD [Agitococcus lubricus]
MDFYVDDEGWLWPARHCPSPNFNQRPSTPISLVVVHNISLPPKQFGGAYIEQLFTNCLDPQAHPYFAEIAHLRVSAHLLIRRQGEVIQFVPFSARAWHAGQSRYQTRDNCNDFSIGIELEGADDIAYEAIQYRQLADIICVLKHTYPAIEDHITGHSDIAPERKTDPGSAFDWALLHDYLRA